MKRLTITLVAAAAAVHAFAQEAMFPTPDAKTLGMGGVAMTTLSGSHALYGNSATAAFSLMPSQISSSYYGQDESDYYAVSGYWRVRPFHPPPGRPPSPPTASPPGWFRVPAAYSGRG